MRTEKLAHWAEIISSLVVVITLVFLIHEVQRNTRALERQTFRERHADLTTPFFEAPELASILAKIREVDGADPFQQALAERYDLTPAEAVLWERHLIQVWMGLQTDFYLGIEPLDVSVILQLLLSSPDNQLLWETMAPSSGAAFRAFVDSLAAEIGPGS